MLYLAKLQKMGAAQVPLTLLVRQTTEGNWAIAPSDATAFVVEAVGNFLATNTPVQEGLVQDGFVLVEVSESGQVKHIKDATPWVLTLVEQYLSRSLTPEQLEQEAERAEEWRQSLTLQNLDVSRRSLEVETRREQIQELERGLEEKRTKLDVQAEELATEQAALARQQQQVDDDLAMLKAQQDDWHRRKEELLQELTELEARKQQLERDR